MSGKQSKKERKALREAERERLRKQERQRTIFTTIVIAVVILIGGVLVYVSLDRPADELDLAEELEDLMDEDAEDAEDAEGAEDPEGEEVALQDRPVACGAEEPAGAGEQRSTYEEPEQVIADGVDYQAVIETSCGTVVIDLDSERAPETVNSFVFLAQDGFFDGRLIFRNATTIDALQTGSGTDDASWQLGYTLPGELQAVEEDGYEPGTVAMANTGDPDTGGSQFFMVYGDAFQSGVEAGNLQPIYTRFGLVIEGFDVLEQIGAIPTDGPADETPTERVYMESVTITTAGDAEPTEDAEPTDDEDTATETEDPTDEPTE